MKTISLFKSGLFVMAIAATLLTACKKDKNDPEPDTSSLTQITVDENRIGSAEDLALKDANDLLSSNGSKAQLWVPCNATLDSSSVVNDTITYHITYLGLNCNGNYNRTGQVDVKKNVTIPWLTAGCKVYVTFLNLYVTRVSDSKSVTLNGTKIYENVSGGRLIDLGTTATSIVHKVSGSVQATLDDNSVVTWSISREKTYTGTVGNLTLTIDGLGSAGGYNDLVTWGLTRNGENFYTVIITPVAYIESCGWDPNSGVKIYQIPGESKKAIVTFGYDVNNQPVSGGVCATRARVDWEKDGQTGTLYVQI